MKIVVLNGSPKGETSVTMQYVAFMQKKFSQHEFEILHITQEIRQIEAEEPTFSRILEKIKAADGILWAFPLYVFLVHAQYKRFIELLHERKVTAYFYQKPAAILTTSIHFFDYTAHNYLHGICDDMNMKLYGTFSAAMDDLFKEEQQLKLQQFTLGFLEGIVRNAPSARVYPPLIQKQAEYVPGLAGDPIETKGQKVVILTDGKEPHTNLNRMVEKFAASLNQQVEVINLHSINIKGGCLGCIRCGYDNTCIYTGKDGFIEFYNSKIKTADVLVFAGAIYDRYLSSLWKNFFDRAFFNTHMPSLVEKQVAFLISGPLGQLPNLRQILEAYTEWQQANLVGIVTDEYTDSREIDELLQDLAIRSIEFANRKYIKPPTFLSVGGMKIFRDEIWGSLRFPFVADHKYYKRNGVYDFPQKNYSTRVRNLFLRVLIKVPKIRKEIYGKIMITKMIEPFQKLLKKL